MKKIRIFIFTLLLVSAGVYVSCSKDSAESNIAESNNLDLTVFGKQYDYYNRSNGNFDMSYLNVDKHIKSDVLVVKESFQDILINTLDFYGINNSNSIDLQGITFYGKNLNLNVNTNITGFSLLYNTATGFRQEMFKIIEGKAVIQSQFTKDYSYTVLLKSFAYFSHSLDQLNESYLLIINGNSKSKKINIKSGGKDYKLELADLEQSPVINVNHVYGSQEYCTQCGSNTRGICGVNGGEDVECNYDDSYDGTICGKSRDGEETGPVGPVDEEISQQHSMAMYSVRDNILSLSGMGQKYIDFYYKLSYVFEITSVYTNRTSEIHDVMLFIGKKSKELVDGGNNHIIITKNDLQYVKAKISSFRNVTVNPEYHSILNTIETDIENLENKTKADIILYLI